MSKTKPKKDPNQGKTPAQIDAENKAKGVNDVESDEYMVTVILLNNFTFLFLKFELRKEIRILKKSQLEEERLLSFYQQEREKINYNWIIGKKELEDKKSDFINKEREIQDLQENHFMTLNLHKQRLKIILYLTFRIKHLLFQNQDQQSDLRKDVEVTLKQLEDEHRLKDRELKTDIRSLKVQQKEQDLAHNEYMFALKTEFDRQATILRQEYEREANDMKRRYDLKMQKLRGEMEDARAQLIKALEEKKDTRIAQLTKEHSKKYTEIKNYYSDITATNLDLIKTLKNEINTYQKKEDGDKKLLQQIERENKDLSEPLKQLNDEIKQLTVQLEEQKKVIAKKENLKRKIETSEIKFRKLEYEYEVKLQHFKYLERDKNQLLDKFNQAIYSIHQKTGLQNLILEKKNATIQDDLEIKDLQLNQVLQAANIDPKSLGAITSSFQEVDQVKSSLISELQQQLSQIRKAHSHMVKAYEGKLAEFVIPVEELGFDPLVPTNTE